MATKKQATPDDNGAETATADTAGTAAEPAPAQTLGGDLPPTGVSTDEHQFTLYGEEGAWFWRCTCGQTGKPVDDERRPYELWVGHSQRATAGEAETED
jgi:hypothetical protein